MEGYVEHAVDARILVLRPRNFLHPDETLKFVFSSEKTNIQKSSAALTLSINLYRDLFVDRFGYSETYSVRSHLSVTGSLVIGYGVLLSTRMVSLLPQALNPAYHQ